LKIQPLTQPPSTMTNMNALIVEDDPESVLLLQHFISRLPFFNTPDVVKSGGEAISALHNKAYDLVFLDMFLPDINGKTIMETGTKYPPVIVTTVSPDFASDCYDLDVVDYLVKPFEFSRFLRAVNRALEQVKIMDNSISNKTSIYLKVGRKVQHFAYELIDYVEAYGIYCKVWHNNQSLVVNDSIGELNERLSKKYFLRIHKSYIINIEKISSYDHKEIEINNLKIPIGISYKSQLTGLMELLNKK
jgi:DNA-binding LytR/AlgR family response regulator